MRGREYPLRRREGRRDLRSFEALEIGTRADYAALHSGLSDWFGPERDVPAPDIGTNEQTMAWVMDTYSMHVRQATTAVVTGKPLELGGSQGRKEATGRGLMICCNKAIAKFGMQREKCRVDHTGIRQRRLRSGAVLMHKAGYKIVGVADIHGGLYNEKGFDIAKLHEWVYEQRKPLPDFPARRRKNARAGRFSSSHATFCYPPPPRIRLPHRTPIGSSAEFSAKGPTGRPRRMLIPLSRRAASSSFRIFSGMRAV